jgi:hypothetical protein
MRVEKSVHSQCQYAVRMFTKVGFFCGRETQGKAAMRLDEQKNASKASVMISQREIGQCLDSIRAAAESGETGVRFIVSWQTSINPSTFFTFFCVL